MNTEDYIDIKVSFMPAKYARISTEYLEFKGKRIYYKDAKSISWSINRTSMSGIPVDQSYFFNLADDDKTINLSLNAPLFKNKKEFSENFNILLNISDRFIEPVIIDKLYKKLRQGDVLDFVLFKLSKDGILYKPLFRKEKVYPWSSYYQSEMVAGSLQVYTGNKGEKPNLLAVVSMKNENAVLLTKLLAKCANELG